MMEFRVLTLWQPWASLIALGLKQYETRGKNPGKTAYRGKLLIHAAKRLLDDEALEAIWEVEELTGKALNPVDFKYPLGCIVAIADLTDSLEMVYPMDFTQKAGQICINHQTDLERAVGNWKEGRYALKLENVIALPEPIPCQGGQGLRKLNDHEIAQQLESLLLSHNPIVSSPQMG